MFTNRSIPQLMPLSSQNILHHPQSPSFLHPSELYSVQLSHHNYRTTTILTLSTTYLLTTHTMYNLLYMLHSLLLKIAHFQVELTVSLLPVFEVFHETIYKINTFYNGQTHYDRQRLIIMDNKWTHNSDTLIQWTHAAMMDTHLRHGM